jgi:hypothetical protein
MDCDSIAVFFVSSTLLNPYVMNAKTPAPIAKPVPSPNKDSKVLAFASQTPK